MVVKHLVKFCVSSSKLWKGSPFISGVKFFDKHTCTHRQKTVPNQTDLIDWYTNKNYTRACISFIAQNLTKSSSISMFNKMLLCCIKFFCLTGPSVHIGHELSGPGRVESYLCFTYFFFLRALKISTHQQVCSCFFIFSMMLSDQVEQLLSLDTPLAELLRWSILTCIQYFVRKDFTSTQLLVYSTKFLDSSNFSIYLW